MDTTIVLATAGLDNTIRMWQTQTGSCLFTFKHPDSQVNAISLASSGSMLAAAGYEHVRIYDTMNPSPEWIAQINKFKQNVNTIGFSEDARLMFTGGDDAIARIFDLKTNTCIQMYQARGSIGSAVLHQNQRELILGDDQGEINIWDLRSDKNNDLLKPESSLSSLQSRQNPNSQISSKSISLSTGIGPVPLGPNQHLLQNKMQNFTIGGSSTMPPGHNPTSGVPNGAYNNVHKPPPIISTNTVAPASICSPHLSIQSLALSDDCRSLAALNAAGNCYVYNLRSNTATRATLKQASIPKHLRYGLKVQFSPDGTMLVLCGADRQFKLLKTADFTLINSFGSLDMRWVWDCAFSADSQYLLTASSDGVGRLWHLDTTEVMREFRGHQKAITCLAFKDSSVVPEEGCRPAIESC